MYKRQTLVSSDSFKKVNSKETTFNEIYSETTDKICLLYTSKGDSEVFGISLNELGLYNIEITMKSEQGSLSQLPLSIYYDNALKSTITIRCV